MKIITDYQPDGEWMAYDADTYDCDCDENGFFSHSPVGHGRTPTEAIRDLMEEMEDRAARQNYGEYSRC